LCRLSQDIFARFNTLDFESRQRDVQSWRPVILLILKGVTQLSNELVRIRYGVSLFTSSHFFQSCMLITDFVFFFPIDQFLKHIPVFYSQAITLLQNEVTPEMRLALHALLVR
jgi:hypothetical protein